MFCPLQIYICEGSLPISAGYLSYLTERVSGNDDNNNAYNLESESGQECESGNEDENNANCLESKFDQESESGNEDENSIQNLSLIHI